MTTKFDDVKGCLAQVAFVVNIPYLAVEAAYEETKSEIHIGWPHDQDAIKFRVGGYDYAISDFRDGKCLWSIASMGMMFRV